MNALINRFREPSTWAGLAALAGLLGHPVPDDVVAALPQLVGLGGAVLAVLVPEQGAK